MSAIAIFTGLNSDKMSIGYRYDFYGTRIDYSYKTLSILDYSDEELSSSDNPFALALLVAKKALLKGKGEDLDKRLLKQKILIARKLFSKGLFEKPKIKAVLIFLNNYLLFKNSKMNDIFEKEIDKITGKKNTMGILEQLAEIKANEADDKARSEFVISLLKGSEFSPEKIASLANVSLDFVKKVKKSLVSPKPN